MRRILIQIIVLLLVATASFAGRYYNGSTWIDTTRKYYNGSAWITTVTKRFDGSQWVSLYSGGAGPISDSFSTDTSSNYTRFNGTGTIAIASGVARTSTYNLNAYYYNNTDIGSSSMVVQGVLCDGAGTTNKSALVLRSNGTTGHGCAPDVSNNRFTCTALGGSGTNAYRSWTSGAWTDGACHLVKIAVDSSNVYTFNMDLNDDGDFLDTNESPGTVTDASYTGTKAGIGWVYGSVANDIYVDNFSAVAN